MFETQSPHSWQESLAPGDIVLFQFPSTEGDPRYEKDRPCLVAEIDHGAGGPTALVFYGTGADSRSNRGFEVRIRREDDYAAAGLDRPTRFIGSRSTRVPLSDKRFRSDRPGGPRLGTLPPLLLQRLERILGIQRSLPPEPQSGHFAKNIRANVLEGPRMNAST